MKIGKWDDARLTKGGRRVEFWKATKVGSTDVIFGLVRSVDGEVLYPVAWRLEDGACYIDGRSGAALDLAKPPMKSFQMTTYFLYNPHRDSGRVLGITYPEEDTHSSARLDWWTSRGFIHLRTRTETVEYEE